MHSIVLWDVMGTLVHDPFFVEMPEFFEMSFDALLEAKHPSAWVEFELGKCSEEDFLRSFFSDGRAFDHELWMREEVLAGLRRLTDAVHREGAAASIQLGHCGFFTSRKVAGKRPLGASPKFCLFMRSRCRAMTPKLHNLREERLREERLREERLPLAILPLPLEEVGSQAQERASP